MPRRRDPNRPRWEWEGVPGFMAPCTQREGGRDYAYHYYMTRRQSSRIPFNDEFKTIARKRHLAWVKSILLEEIVPAPRVSSSENGPRSVLTASALILKATGHSLPENSKIKLRQALNVHFQQDVELTFQAIHDHLVMSIATATYKIGDEEIRYNQASLRKQLMEINRVLRHCVVRGWLERNPLDVIGMPKQKAKDGGLVWSRSEINALLAQLRKSRSRHAVWVALMIEWMSYTAMRPSEILRMRWEHITDRELQIPKTKTGKARAIPLVDLRKLKGHPERAAWQRRLHEILDELRRLYDEHRSDLLRDWHTAGWKEGNIWPWQNTNTVNLEFRAAREALKFVDQRRFYDLRATAEDFWVWELGLDMETVCEFAGHSPAIYIKHYRRRYGQGDREALLTGTR